MGMFYTHKLGDKWDLHILQYHLECIALEQAPTKWICDACEASGPARAKCPRKWHNITILGNVPDYLVSKSREIGVTKKIDPVYIFSIHEYPWRHWHFWIECNSSSINFNASAIRETENFSFNFHFWNCFFINSALGYNHHTVFSILPMRMGKSW